MAAQPLPPLPIDAVLPQLLTALRARASAVVVAPPGAGKTTRIPLALLTEPWATGKVLVLEPRRLAARAAAEHMARLLGEEVGQTIGYRIRFDTKVSAVTRIEVVTEGVFTRLVIADPSMPGISAVLFDEFHERSLDADLGLALALDAQAGLREDLRLVAMSATLDAARVATLMDEAPVVQSEGRAFPVETRYRPRPSDQRIEDAMAAAILDSLANQQGSILAFLPGVAEILRTAERLEGRVGSHVTVARLAGTLDRTEQDRAIRPSPPGERKVVLATSIAETSLTIEGVRVVIDSGLARVPRYEPASGLTRLETVRVSQAAADQRRGRAGRTEPGLCVRLWEEGQTRALAPFTTPEILSADLTSLVLDCAACGIARPETLRFLDTPPQPALEEARALLRDLDAIDADGRITPEGQALTGLPLHPRLAHMMHRAEAAEVLLAAEIGVLLGERGLGGSDSDVRHRLRLWRGDRSGRAREARRLASEWARRVGGSATGEPPADRAGALLALAYPDRLAKARPGKPGEFLTVSGRGVAVDPADALAREPWIVAAEVTGSATRGRVVLAAPVDENEVLETFGERVVDAEELTFDTTARAVRARRVRRLGRITLTSAPVPAAGEAATRALLEGLGGLGIDALPWTRAARQLLGRIRFLLAGMEDETVSLDDARLAAELAEWLGPFVPGATSASDIGEAALVTALLARAGLDRRTLDAEAPTHFEAPTGSRVPIDYDSERGPSVAIRVQEVFGLKTHPMLGRGRIPLTLELLSPAHRPIQTTRDLPGFWLGSWAGVRADLRGRYPRHPWPEDPAEAAPTTRAKPRGT